MYDRRVKPFYENYTKGWRTALPWEELKTETKEFWYREWLERTFKHTNKPARS